MSLQELRETLFYYTYKNLREKLGADELTAGSPAYYGAQSLFHTGSAFRDPDTSKLEKLNGKDWQEIDEIIIMILGGERGTECFWNENGPCTYEYDGIFYPVAPDFEFNLKGEDPTFLGGWLSDDAPFG